MRPTYAQFRQDVLLTAVEIHHAVSTYSVSLKIISERLKYEVPQAWEEQVIPDLESSGLVEDASTLSDRSFRVLGSGFEAADEILQARKAPTLTERLTSEKTQRLINVWTLLLSVIATAISLGALWVAYVALGRS